ncbi:MAG: MoaD/ThiS family protein [Chitinophagales bacterium]
MKITVLLFAQLSELFQTDKMELNDVASVNELICRLEKNQSELKNQKYSIAINETITKENMSLNDGDIIALLPPFAGG